MWIKWIISQFPQLGPVKPDIQLQEYEQVLVFVMHIPPFKHGEELHGLLSLLFYKKIKLKLFFVFY